VLTVCSVPRSEENRTSGEIDHDHLSRAVERGVEEAAWQIDDEVARVLSHREAAGCSECREVHLDDLDGPLPADRLRSTWAECAPAKSDERDEEVGTVAFGLWTGPRARQRRLVLFVVVLSFGFAVLVAARAGDATAASSACGYGSSSGNVRTCVSVGNTTVSSSSTVVSSARVLQSCLHRDGVRLGCTAYTYVPAGSSIGFQSVFGGGVPSGTYCALTWRRNTDGSTTQIGSECIGVTVIG
jgi:hypothetical protein